MSSDRVIEEPLYWRRSRRVAFTPTPPPDKPEPVRRPAKVARQLALAHHLQAAIERGLVADQATLARKLGFTRARVTQLFDLLMLASDLQEQVLALEAVDGAEPMAERALRAVARAGTWAEQRAAWRELVTSETQPSIDSAPLRDGPVRAPAAALRRRTSLRPPGVS